MSNTKSNYKELINKYNFDYLLIAKRYKMYNYIEDNDEYEIIYENKNLGLYKKTVIN